MMREPAFLGVEGGGSTARAILEYRGRVLARTEWKGLNPNDIGYGEFESRLRSLLPPLLGTLDSVRTPICACFALAGAGNPAVRRKCRAIITGIVREYGRCRYLRVISDAEALLQAFEGKRGGIVLIAGTGSICLGLRRSGGKTVVARAGGWGGSLDEGSGFKMGMALLKHALRTLDRLEPPSVSVDLLCRRHRISIAELPSRFLPPDPTLKRGEIASLARIVLDAYGQTDPFARSLVRDSVARLVEMVAAVKKQAGLSDDVQVLASGGLLRSKIMWNQLRKRMKRVLPQVSLSKVTEPLVDTLEVAKMMDRPHGPS